MAPIGARRGRAQVGIIIGVKGVVSELGSTGRHPSRRRAQRAKLGFRPLALASNTWGGCEELEVWSASGGRCLALEMLPVGGAASKGCLACHSTYEHFIQTATSSSTALPCCSALPAQSPKGP
eukprot:66874-Chlamydomonas_euryale.AAC.1